MQVVDVAALLDYVGRKRPELPATLRGVPRSAIDAVQAQHSIVLPASYVDFLLAMGEDSDGLDPLGATQSHRFSSVGVKRPRGYPPQRLFRVSYETDEMALARMDRFLDLAHADANDALLVDFEPGADIDTLILEGMPTFGEELFSTVFQGLDVFSRPYTPSVFVRSLDAAERLRVKDAATALLIEMGFVPALPDMERVACLDREDAGVLVGVFDETHIVELRCGGTDRAALEAVLERALAELPGAWRPETNDGMSET
jgi:hypothetical protein